MLLSPIKNPCNNGFTLIEMSVVLVIIGLVVGGILYGRDMIRSSEVQSMITDEVKYIEAAKQFKEKYNFLPGDFPNATSIWGANSACPGSNATRQQATCNGDGDGFIESDGNGAGAADSWENFTAWQQLADAGYIEGIFTGTNGSLDQADNEPGLNVPETRRVGGGFEWYVFTSAGSYASNNWWFSPINYKQYLWLAAQTGGHGSDLLQPLLTGGEALNLDSKIDDGIPGTGNVTSSNSSLYSPACTTTSVATTAVYKTNNIRQCMLLFQINF